MVVCFNIAFAMWFVAFRLTVARHGPEIIAFAVQFVAFKLTDARHGPELIAFATCMRFVAFPIMADFMCKPIYMYMQIQMSLSFPLVTFVNTFGL